MKPPPTQRRRRLGMIIQFSADRSAGAGIGPIPAPCTRSVGAGMSSAGPGIGPIRGSAHLVAGRIGKMRETRSAGPGIGPDGTGIGLGSVRFELRSDRFKSIYNTA